MACCQTAKALSLYKASNKKAAEAASIRTNPLIIVSVLLTLCRARFKLLLFVWFVLAYYQQSRVLTFVSAGVTNVNFFTRIKPGVALDTSTKAIIIFNMPSESETDTFISIGGLADRTGCGPDMVRYYERIGLLPKPARSTGGHRLYRTAAI